MVCFDSSTSRIRLKDDLTKLVWVNVFLTAIGCLYVVQITWYFLKTERIHFFWSFWMAMQTLALKFPNQMPASSDRQYQQLMFYDYTLQMQQCSFESFYSVPRSSLAAVQRMHEKYLSYAKIQTIKDGYKSVLAKLFQWSQTVNNAF